MLFKKGAFIIWLIQCFQLRAKISSQLDSKTKLLHKSRVLNSADYTLRQHRFQGVAREGIQHTVLGRELLLEPISHG